MRRFAFVLLLVVAVAALVSCQKAQQAGETASEAAGQVAEQAQQAAGQVGEAAANLVQVAEEGTEFDPPVPVEALPDGAWYCEMDGKCHYARMTEGDGKCAVCGMPLKHKETAQHEEGEPAHEHGEEAATS